MSNFDLDERAALLEANRPKFKKIFSKHSSNNDKMSFQEFQKFCKNVKIFPDLLTMVEMKRMISIILHGTQSQANQIQNNTYLLYMDFEKVLAEISHSTLQVAHSLTEKLKIFLMHIRNACKTNYQIPNFTLEKRQQPRNQFGGSLNRAQNSGVDKYQNMPLQMKAQNQQESHIGLALKALKQQAPPPLNADINSVLQSQDEQYFSNSNQFKQSRFTDHGGNPRLQTLDTESLEKLSQSTYQGCQTTRQIYRSNQPSLGTDIVQVNSARGIYQPNQDHELKEFMQLEQQVMGQGEIHYNEQDPNETGDFIKDQSANGNEYAIQGGKQGNPPRQSRMKTPANLPQSQSKQNSQSKQQYLPSYSNSRPARVSTDAVKRVKGSNGSDGAINFKIDQTSNTQAHHNNSAAQISNTKTQPTPHHQSSFSQSQLSDNGRGSFTGNAVIRLQDLTNTSTEQNSQNQGQRQSRQDQRESSVEQINAKIKDLLDSKHQDFLSPTNSQRRSISKPSAHAAAQPYETASRRLVSPQSNFNSSQEVKISHIDLTPNGTKRLVSPNQNKVDQKPFGFKQSSRGAGNDGVPIIKNMKQSEPDESYSKDDLLQKLRETNQKLAEAQRVQSVNSSVTHQSQASLAQSSYQIYKGTPTNAGNKENSTPGQNPYLGQYSQKTLAPSEQSSCLQVNNSAMNISQTTGPPTFDNKKSNKNIDNDMLQEIRTSQEGNYIQNLLNELGKAKEEVGQLKKAQEEFLEFKKEKLLKSCLSILHRIRTKETFSKWNGVVSFEKKNERLVYNVGQKMISQAQMTLNQSLSKWKLHTQQDRQSQIEEGLTSQFSRILFINKIAHSFIQRDADQLGPTRALNIWKSALMEEKLRNVSKAKEMGDEVVCELKDKWEEERCEINSERSKRESFERRIEGATRLIQDFISRHD